MLDICLGLNTLNAVLIHSLYTNLESMNGQFVERHVMVAYDDLV